MQKIISIVFIVLLVATLVYAIEDDFPCKRCGRCCLELVSPKMWLGDLTWEQKQVLVAERKKYPPLKRTSRKGCDMLYFKKGLAHCLVREVFGWELTPQGCRDYPLPGTKCLNGIMRTEMSAISSNGKN